ncbi:hypothetical protein NA57DRAFT_81435 [Rhizodiscina lignyota]|uniref:protein-histidine N-methyltransferase n=1 Tax=Rhizodiscina lignyota TaxID=1504668 RepID=A0A9P4M1I8_9PEZI|nr:hypothetical protein NA57DRAFT_81435 [Rhizodiscina lignyota]
MSGSFAFGFSGDDIEDGDGIGRGEAEQPRRPKASSSTANSAEQEVTTSAPAQAHDVEKLLATLPSQISYSSIEIESPKGKKLLLPRRELFDIRMQLAAEDDGDDDNEAELSNLEGSDIRTNVYEGGFKSWECSIDLARLLLDRGPRKDIDDLCRVDHVIELGCGTAIPTLILFHYALVSELSIYFTLSDFNAAVLRLVTLPNLLLTWASTVAEMDAPFSAASPNPLATSPAGELEVTPTLTKAFLSTLRNQNLILNLISGSWSPAPQFTNLISHAPEMNTLVLASETIYSSASLSTFTEALIGILKRVRMGKAMVAAKRVYFGVGGSVDTFKTECAGGGAVAYEIDNTGMDLDASGVRRCLMEVQMM